MRHNLSDIIPVHMREQECVHKYENAFEIQPKLLKLVRTRIKEHKRDARAQNILKDYVTKLVTINCLNQGLVKLS